DLSACAVTGAREGLAYVSPRSGRAVSRAGAGEWADRLLPLPALMGGAGDNRGRDLAEGLAITGHFLEHRLAAELVGRHLPAARARLVRRLEAGRGRTPDLP
uniref:DNA repair protein RecO C-terminal domain-containing protein n=1 Tax=Paracoccus sp. T5 TaxID=3402161 RepID=UPI003AE2B25C